MSNFDPRPGRPNSIAPGRMPLFAVPATIAVRDGRAVLACGGSGGYRITSGVVHATVNVLDHGLPGGRRGRRTARVVPGRGDVRRRARPGRRCATSSRRAATTWLSSR